MSAHHPKKKKKTTPGSNPSPTTGSPADSQFILDDVKSLFADLTSPETNVTFNTAPRANPSSIQNTINPPLTPVIYWNWQDDKPNNPKGRVAQQVQASDVGKYGLQADSNTLYQLIGVEPQPNGIRLGTWQSVQNDKYITWIWPDEQSPVVGRDAQKVQATDVGRLGLQQDIKTLFKLVSASNPPGWLMMLDDTTTTSPFELSTGAADATAYHDFYRVQIAFQPVWGELLDANIPTLGERLFALYDATMSQNDQYSLTYNKNGPYWVDSTGNDAITGRAKVFDAPPTTDISGADELQEFIDFLKIQFGLGNDMSPDVTPQITQLRTALTNTLYGCDMLLAQLARLADDVNGNSIVGTQEFGWSGQKWLDQSPTNIGGWQVGPQIPITPHDSRKEVFTCIVDQLGLSSSGSSPVNPFQDLNKLLKSLDQALSEPYRFDVFAPDSVNYGLLLNYQQRWQPLSYQVGNLVSSIPLAPQETRRYTTKSVVKKSRSQKEIDNSLSSNKTDISDTRRDDAEIVERAKNSTNFKANASGGVNLGIFNVSGGVSMEQNQDTESQQTRREFHEAVMKSAQEYRNEHRMEVNTEESREDESTSFREIRNPNDELTVTYLFYELQRRYAVSEALHKVTPIILVANDVPAPHEVDPGWLLRHDWIIKRTILDKSFIAALDYLSTNYTGEELTLQVLGLQVEQQNAIVEKISSQVKVANDALNSAALKLNSAQQLEVTDLEAPSGGLLGSITHGIFGGATDSGEADRAAVSFAKDALDRAQSKADQIVAQLRAETTALQVAVDKYTKAATEHFTMLAEIDRLRIHVKDNILYYMQAIWTYEPPDQRYFRLYNIEVPVFIKDPSVSVTIPVTPDTGLSQLDTENTTLNVKLPVISFPWPNKPTPPTKKLHEVADIENLIGFKGNYMMFPMVEFNYMTWFLMQNYLTFDGVNVGAKDADPLAGLTIDDVKSIMAKIQAKNDGSFEANRSVFEAILSQMLTHENPEMVVVPSKSLYIEALPGTHPLLEDFKLIHRAIDIKKAQAEARHAELENLRLAARLEKSELGDPDIDKVVVVGGGKNVTVDAGQ